MLLVYTIREYRDDMLKLISVFPDFGSISNSMEDIEGNYHNWYKDIILTDVNEIDRKQMLGINSDISNIFGHSDNVLDLCDSVFRAWETHGLSSVDFKQKRSTLHRGRDYSNVGNTYTYINDLVKAFNVAEEPNPNIMPNEIIIDTRWYDTLKTRFCLVTVPVTMIYMIKANPDEALKKIYGRILEDKSTGVEDLIGSSAFDRYLKLIEVSL